MARIVPWVTGTSYTFPVRLSVMDKVSRRVEEEASSAFACVAGSAESMNLHLNECGGSGRLGISHCTLKRARVEMKRKKALNGPKCMGIRVFNGWCGLPS